LGPFTCGIKSAIDHPTNTAIFYRATVPRERSQRLPQTRLQAGKSRSFKPGTSSIPRSYIVGFVRAHGIGVAQSWSIVAMTILKWALIFFVVSIIAGILGFTGISAASADVARFLFYVFVVIFLVLLILGLTIFRV
jgi:uncharacterized membrane protein YtjA (UPF0391 family)